MSINQKGIEEFNIKIYEGSEWKETFQWLDSDKIPIDVTGFGARFMVKKRIEDSDVDAVVSLTHASGIGVGSSDGIFIVSIPVASTLDWGFNYGVWALEVFPDPSFPTKNVRLLTFGQVQYFKEVING